MPFPNGLAPYVRMGKSATGPANVISEIGPIRGGYTYAGGQATVDGMSCMSFMSP